ncbi:MAG: hypothetical protein WCT14_21920 [Treponemataceae bacterium]
MDKNITLKLDEDVLKLCRYDAVEHDKSLSQWVSDVLTERVKGLDDYRQAKERALERLNKGLKLGGTPLDRESAHER